MADWSDLIGRIFLVVGGFVLVYEGSRRVSSRGVHLKTLWPLVIGGLICGSLGAFQLHLSAQLGGTERGSLFEELPADWGKDLSPDQRTRDSKAYARLGLEVRGKVLSYFTPSGEREIYCPSEADIEARVRNVEIRTVALDQVDASRRSAWFALGGALFAALFGLVAGIPERRTKNPANPSLHRSRQNAAL